MSELPVPLTGVAPAPALTDALRSARDYASVEKSAGTRRAYKSDWTHFTSWCRDVSAEPLPATPATLAAYVSALADIGRKYSTIRRRVAAIAYVHWLKELRPPQDTKAVKTVMRGIRRTIGVKVNRKAPTTARVIAGMLKRLPDTMTGKRDRALLLIGFAAARRRSEIVALDVADLEFTEAGVIITIRRSKTDQEGEGRIVPVPNGTRLKPVEALRAWLDAAGITDGAIFRPIDKAGHVQPKRLTDRSVANIVKARASAAKLDPAIFSGHSLRAGFVTQALLDGVDPFKVMDITLHADINTLRDYDRRAKAFKDHAGGKFL